MQIEKNKVVKIDHTWKDDNGRVVITVREAATEELEHGHVHG